MAVSQKPLPGQSRGLFGDVGLALNMGEQRGGALPVVRSQLPRELARPRNYKPGPFDVPRGGARGGVRSGGQSVSPRVLRAQAVLRSTDLLAARRAHRPGSFWPAFVAAQASQGRVSTPAAFRAWLYRTHSVVGGAPQAPRVPAQLTRTSPVQRKPFWSSLLGVRLTGE